MAGEQTDSNGSAKKVHELKYLYTADGQRHEVDALHYSQWGGENTAYTLNIHEDLLGSATAYTYQGGWNDGQWANKHEFNAWGYNTKSPTYNYDPMYRSTEPYFTGHQFDGSLNIYYADHRFYDAETGTWLSPDPVKDGLNWYEYCGNNPVTYIDPTGLTKDPVPSLHQQYKSPGESDYGITYSLDEEEKLFVAVVAAESIGENQLAWQVVANVIMNRVGQREWSNLKTPTEVMKKEHQFSCLNGEGSQQYHLAVAYLENRVDDGNIYEQIISVVMPIYHKEVPDVTGGAQLYYSPKSMNPPGAAPSWASKYKQITVPGISSDDFMLYTGELIQ